MSFLVYFEEEQSSIDIYKKMNIYQAVIPISACFLEIIVAQLFNRDLKYILDLLLSSVTIEVSKRSCNKHDFFGLAVHAWSSDFNTFHSKSYLR